MARTSKTRIRGGSGEQSERMSRALEAGTAGRQRAHEAYLEQARSGSRDITNAALQVGQLAEQGESRQQRGDIAARGQALQERGQDIEAADKGIEGTPPVESYLDKRKAKTEADMAQGEQQPPAAPGGAGPGPLPSEEIERLRAQAEKPMEYTGTQGYQSTGPRKSASRLAREAQENRLIEQRIELNDQRLAKGAFDYQQAQAQPPGEKRDEAQKIALNGMEKAITESQDLINQVMRGELTPEMVAKSFPDNENLASGEVDQGRIVQFLRTRLGNQQVAYMASSGKMPPGYDPSNPVIRQYNARFNEVAASFRQMGNLTGVDLTQGDAFDQATAQQEGGALAGAWQGIKSVDERNDFLRKTTAQIMVEAERYKVDQSRMLKASGFQEQMAQKDSTIAEMQGIIDRQNERLALLGANVDENVQTEMRQGRDEQGNPVTPPVEVKRAGPADERRVKAMQDEDQRARDTRRRNRNYGAGGNPYNVGRNW